MLDHIEIENFDIFIINKITSFFKNYNPNNNENNYIFRLLITDIFETLIYYDYDTNNYLESNFIKKNYKHSAKKNIKENNSIILKDIKNIYYIYRIRKIFEILESFYISLTKIKNKQFIVDYNDNNIFYIKYKNYNKKFKLIDIIFNKSEINFNYDLDILYLNFL